MTKSDITKTIISSDYILSNIHAIFPESVFLDRRYNILRASINVCTEFGYSLYELVGQPVSILEASGNLKELLRDKLTCGHFTDEPISILTRGGANVFCSVSGFYLGLLCDSSEIIVLRFNSKKELEDLDEKLQQTRNQIDQFIYRAAHDLRGPLATMQGLLNLLKMRSNDEDVDNFIHMIDAHAKKLDERLGQLVYLAQVEEQLEQPLFRLEFSAVETSLRRVIEKNAFVDFLELIVCPVHPVVTGYNELQIKAILANLLMYVLAVPKTTSHNVIEISASDVNHLLTIVMTSRGFSTSIEMERDFNNINASRYLDVMQSPKFTHLFAAQKLALKAHALVSLEVIDGTTFEISISMPKIGQGLNVPA
jgi:hypothetical protein